MANDKDGRTWPSQPFLRSNARKFGIPDRAFKGHRFRPLLHGVRVDRHTALTPRVWGRAALLVHPKGAFISHRTAAAVYGLPVPKHADVDVSVTRAEDRRFGSGIRPHLARDDDDVVELRGLRISSPCRVFAELARTHTLVDLVVLGDRMVRDELCTLEELRAFVREWKGYYRRRAVRAADLVRRGVDSPMETRLRLLIVLAGMPEPMVNHKVRWADGRVRWRFDLSYPGVRLIVEYDGRHHGYDADQWERDGSRRGELEREGWSLVIITSSGIYQSPLQTLERVRAALIRCGHPGVPAHFNDEWTAHFSNR